LTLAQVCRIPGNPVKNSKKALPAKLGRAFIATLRIIPMISRRHPKNGIGEN